jgi:LysR family transcriptional activator of glutamate synthase operon
MDVRQLRYVEAVARHRHFTRAADELHVAQSALSHQVRRLETELGVALFERTSRRVTPTEAGLAIAARARRVLAELDEARQEVDQLRGALRGRIWIGALQRAGDLDVPAVLARFSLQHPGIEVGLREGLAYDMLAYLAGDEIDAAFCLLDGEVADELSFERLGEDEVVIAFAPGTAPPGAGVDVAQLAERRLVGPRHGSAVTHVLEELFAGASLRLRLALESGDPFLLRSLAARGFGAAILPRSLTELEGPTVEVRSLDPPVSLTVALVWRRDRHSSPAARTFIDFVRREVGQTTGAAGGVDRVRTSA